MSKYYEIITRSRFEVKYHIEAESLEEAIAKIRAEGDTVEFGMQKHLGEEIRCGRITDHTQEEWYDKCHEKGYF